LRGPARVIASDGSTAGKPLLVKDIAVCLEAAASEHASHASQNGQPSRSLEAGKRFAFL
jgi:hypothetical protein